MALKVMMLGDIVGSPGRRVVQQQLPDLRAEHEPDLIIANAENIAGGSGVTPQLIERLRSYGVDAITLGDHIYRNDKIMPELASATHIVRPANLPDAALGRTTMLLEAGHGEKLCVISVLGRLFMNGPLANDPFATVDELLRRVPADAAVIVEIHAEATSEKIALAHHLDGRVAAVVGTHTHVPTADARILPGGTAFQTDLGMCGPYDSVIGRRKDRVLHFMTTGMPARFEVAEGDPRLCGVIIEIGHNRKAKRIERIEAKADLDRAPFNQ